MNEIIIFTLSVQIASPSFCRHPIASKTCNTIKVPLYHEKDAPLDLNIKAYVGQPTCAQFHVFEATRPLPRFSLYTPCGLNAAPEPEGSVVFNLHERLERVSFMQLLLNSHYIYSHFKNTDPFKISSKINHNESQNVIT